MKKTLLTLLVVMLSTFTTWAQENLLKNSDFESWQDNTPTHWQTLNKVGTAKLEKSTTAHAGEAAVLVMGNANSNKRLASEPLQLSPGTYEISLFAKLSSDIPNIKIGYVPLDGDKPRSNQYTYSPYFTTSTNWTEVNHTFTLENPETVCLVLMVQKGTGNVLADDFTLVRKTDGKADGNGGNNGDNNGDNNGGNSDNGNEEPAPGAIYSKALTDNLDGWTLQQGTLPEGLTEIWQHHDKFGLVGSAFVQKDQHQPTQAWAISPEIQLTAKSLLKFEHAHRYASDVQTENTLWIREGQSEWKQLTIPTYSTGKDWKYVSSGEIDLSDYQGKTVQFGFKYVSTDQSTSKWEIKNFTVFPNPTAITHTRTHTAPKGIYDLSGRRLQKPSQGIFIIDGVKQFVD